MTLPEMPFGARVVSVGIDVVAVERFAASLRRTPGLANRLFTAREQVTVSGHPRGPASLAARFAVKEAAAKALGVPTGMDWHDCQVVSEDSGKPRLEVTATVAALPRRWASRTGGSPSPMTPGSPRPSSSRSGDAPGRWSRARTDPQFRAARVGEMEPPPAGESVWPLHDVPPAACDGRDGGVEIVGVEQHQRRPTIRPGVALSPPTSPSPDGDLMPAYSGPYSLNCQPKACS